MTVEMRSGLPIIGFTKATDFDAWLIAQPRTSSGLWLKLAKKEARVASLSKPDAIDAALCHGWIDGQLDKYDDEHWLIRFTPRKRASKWSENNRRRAIELMAEGRMHATGLAEVDRAKEDGRWSAAYAPASTVQIPPDLQTALDASPRAATFFATLKGANRYAILYRISTAKRPETRTKRIVAYVAMLERGETIHG
jgi:uncharacterized protein YdeI (YjbR/CyaY-like superfamily)